MMRPPLVIRTCSAFVAVVDGHGWRLDHTGRWRVLDEAPGIGGTVLSAAEVTDLFAAYGRPLTPQVTP